MVVGAEADEVPGVGGTQVEPVDDVVHVQPAGLGASRHPTSLVAEFDEPAGYADPLEETNRGTFAFNRLLDRWILDPVTEGYRWLVPEPGRKAIALAARSRLPRSE